MRAQTITDYEVIVHGVCYPDYFQGCGVSGTRFDHVATGMGDTTEAAVEDAVCQLCDFGVIEVCDDMYNCMITNAVQQAPVTILDDAGAFVYVSIRYNVEEGVDND